MKAPTVMAFDSAYPGSMFPRPDGAYVERDDAASLAGALLEKFTKQAREIEDLQAALARPEVAAADKLVDALRSVFQEHEEGYGLRCIEQVCSALNAAGALK